MSTEFARLTESLADRYVIERELGQGGMATVYLAEDLRIVARWRSRCSIPNSPP